jgi:hypothetical protein
MNNPETKIGTPNIDRAIQAIYSIKNEYHRDSALRFARISIEKDLPLPKRDKDISNILLDRHILFNSLCHLSKHVLNNLEYAASNLKVDIILENMRYKEKIKYLKKGII